MSFIVYMHINKTNGKRYIGITKNENPNKRWLNGKGYFRNPHFTRAIEKYGWDGFEHIIVADGLTKEIACQWEQSLIALYCCNDKTKGYNITDGGEFFHHSKESRKLMSQNRKGKGLHEFSDEHRKKMSEHHGGGAESKKVICVETGVIYKSINDVARSIGKNKKLISCVCRGVPHYNTAGGYHWRFVEE